MKRAFNFTILSSSFVSFVFAVFFSVIAYRRWNMPYENQKYFDPISGVTYDTDALGLYILLASIFTMAAFLGFFMGYFCFSKHKVEGL